jgi:lipoprotein-anchoring transpeptidase ErfK/SrfK
VKALFCLTLAAALLTTSATATAKKSRTHSKPAAAQKTDTRQIEAATRLQIFLDRANFSPGVISGRYDELTLKALTLYRQANGQSPAAPAKPGRAPDVSGLDLASFGPAFVPYTVSEAEFHAVGPVPSTPAAQAKVKFLPYRNAAEAVAEKFHCDIHFLEQLNPGKTKNLRPGDQLMVPNVEPFDLVAIKDLKPGSDAGVPAANELAGDENSPSPGMNDRSAGTPPAPSSVKIDTKTNALGVFEADKLVAAYPVTIGSAQTQSPIGDWKVTRIAKLPRFRWDEQMLKHGQRSGNFHMLPPGPNSPVGVIWIALNKKGIGIHGTNEPETIGRAASHGCVRLTNWDAVRLAQKIKPGVPVSIH